MNPRDRERVKELLSQAGRLPPEERARFIETAVADPAVTAEALELAGRLDDPHFMCAPTGAGLAAEPGTLLEGPGTRIDRYKLLQKIGEGGFGAVFMAEQTEPVVRRVAFKIIKAGMDTRQVIARFEAERQALALMDHPNIARVLDAGATQTGRPYFVMELVRGVAVTEFCDSERLSLTRRLDLFRDVCGAVQHAHQKGIIHRDIKPSNVLVTMADGRPLPKVIDFGIAKATASRLTDKTLFTEMHQLIGTPQYMSPEQAEVSGIDIDTRSDIYALGVLLFELLTGDTPFDAQRLRSAALSEIQRIIREEEPPSPSVRLKTLVASSRGQLRSAPLAGTASSVVEIAQRRRSEPIGLIRELRSDLDRIVMKCLEKDRSRRYATASALAEDVSRYLANEPVMAAPAGAGYRIRKFLRRHRGAALAAGAVAATLVAATGVSIAFAAAEVRQRKAADRARQDERAQRERADREAAEARRQAQSAKRQREEIELIAEFQADRFRDIDVQKMGARLSTQLLDEARASMKAAHAADAEIEQRLSDFQRQLAALNLSNVALAQLHQNIFEPALAAVHKLKAQPSVKAHLLQTLADSLRDLGLLEQAEAPQAESLAIRRQEFGDDDEQTVATMNNMAGLLKQQGKLDEAEAHYREALQRHRRLKGDQDPGTLVMINNMGAVLSAQGKLKEAEAYCREAVEKSSAALGAQDPQTLQAMNNLASVLHERGQIAQAAALCRKVFEVRQRVLGANHRDTQSAAENLGALLVSEGRLTEAEPLLRAGLDRRRRQFGDEHGETLSSMDSLVYLLRQQGRHQEAESMAREELETSRRAFGPDHPQTVKAVESVAQVLRAMGRHSEAMPYYREVLDKRRAMFGDGNIRVLGAVNNMGVLLRELGKPDQAETLMREAVTISRKTLGNRHRETANCEAGLGRVLCDQSRFAEAEEHLLRAEAIYHVAEAAQPDRYQGCVKSLAELYRKWHAAQPGRRYDKKAAEWESRLHDDKASSQPTA